MTHPLQPGQPHEDGTPTPDTQPLSAEQIDATIKGTTADIRAKLTSEQVEVKKNPPIREESLGKLRQELLDRKEVKALRDLDAGIITQRSEKDDAAVGTLAEEQIKGTENVSMAFLNEAEAECMKPTIDLPKTRILIQLGYSYAKALSAGRHQNPVALNALKAWMATLIEKHPEAAKQLLESYKETMDAEIISEKPDLIWMNQWIDLCTGLAPELASELAEKFDQAIVARCEYFIRQVEAELAKENPNLKVIGQNIVVPSNYYKQLRPDSTIPERVKALEEKYEALRKKVWG